MIQTFFSALRDVQGGTPTKKDVAARTWVYVPYDQLTDAVGPLAERDPEDVGIVLVENPWKAERRPYHRQKLALVLGSQRQFALEQAGRGVKVHYEVGPRGKDARPFRDVLAPLVKRYGPLTTMRPAERELRHDLGPLVADGRLIEIPHAGWLTTAEDFEQGSNRKPPWRMDVFYRHVRKRTGVLMDEDGKPVGGKFSFDVENREPWRGEPPAPEPPTFDVDEVLEEVGELIERRYAHHPGHLDLSALPTRKGQVTALWTWAKTRCLPCFGPYEDAMSTRSRGLFHTRVSPLLNLSRLLPRQLVEDALELDLPQASREGFVRQVLGWREFVRHVHEATDGFREGLPEGVAANVTAKPGDGGFGAWLGRSWSHGGAALRDSGGAAPSALDAHGSLPPAFWGEPSGLRCLDHVVAEVLDSGYSHHITRLMVLSNIATLLDIEPRELTDWFWCVYTDAYDWVVEPNVLGMGTFGVGELFTTKPYVSGAAYIDRMSDFCSECSFHPKKTCPITRLYWAFLARNAERLKDNQRLSLPLRNVAKRKDADKDLDTATFAWVRETLSSGGVLDAESRPT